MFSSSSLTSRQPLLPPSSACISARTTATSTKAGANAPNTRSTSLPGNSTEAINPASTVSSNCSPAAGSLTGRDQPLDRHRQRRQHQPDHHARHATRRDASIQWQPLPTGQPTARRGCRLSVVMGSRISQRRVLASGGFVVYNVSVRLFWRFRREFNVQRSGGGARGRVVGCCDRCLGRACRLFAFVFFPWPLAGTNFDSSRP